MWGSYNSQQRPLTSKKDTKFHSVCFQIAFSGNCNNPVRKTKSRPGVFLEFLQGAREGRRVEKVKLKNNIWAKSENSHMLRDFEKGIYLSPNFI